MAREQLQQQLVQVEAADETVRRERGDGAVELRGGQLAGFAFAAPGNQQPVEGLQDRSQSGARLARAARAAGEHRDATVVAREQFEDPAGVAIGSMMQHVSRLQLHLPRFAHVS